MKTAVFSSKPYDEEFLRAANAAHAHELVFIENRLGAATAPLAAGAAAVCAFVNDQLDAACLAALHAAGVRGVALRCAGYNNVDVSAARRLGLAVARVPAYSPEAVAEHTLALLLTLERRTHKAYNRVRDGNFALDGLLGRTLHGRTVGLVGTGHIGRAFARLALGLGCRVLAHDLTEDAALRARGVTYLPLAELWPAAEILSLHCPLVPATRHLIRRETLALMRDGATLLNTSRGGLVDTEAAIEALKSGRLGALGLDVYEEEAALFFEDRSLRVIQDDVFMRLTTFPNVLVTGHQGFFTREALATIARTTLANLADFAAGRPCPNAV
jgi:D-lactate dehydrogenase